VTPQVALADPEHCVGIHINMLAPAPGDTDPATFDAMEQAAMERFNSFFGGDEGGYFHLQATRPQTVGYGLEDSPAGLAGWIVEKYRAWSDCDGDIERSFTKDQLLDNLMLYWATATAHSSVRFYYEFQHGIMDGSLALGQRVDAPTGYAVYPKEQMQSSRRWAERDFNLVHYERMPRGGHFAAMEVPDLFVDDLRAWKRALPT
jgi:microsomal epoxide hydrolase